MTTSLPTPSGNWYGSKVPSAITATKQDFIYLSVLKTKLKKLAPMYYCGAKTTEKHFCTGWKIKINSSNPSLVIEYTVPYVSTPTSTTAKELNWSACSPAFIPIDDSDIVNLTNKIASISSITLTPIDPR